MITPGQFGVDARGAFTYDIPIAVPPGTAGMAPTLTLDYSSQNGDGVLGYGWALGGLPSIGRCPRTVAQDGVHGGVNYNLNDRFCMSGQRLILTSGTYGADSSQYRTEIDSFSLVTAHGAAGNGPAYFTVQTKAGLTMEFGNTADSQVLATGTSTARAWGVDKITDSVGNYMTFTYTVDAANGVNYPSSINYTGNSAASLAPYNSVQFVYTTRADVTPFYQAGSLTQRTQILTDVKTYAGSTLVADYKLGYTAGTTTRHSELTSVDQCDGSGNCLPATTFGWQGSRDNPAMTALPNGQFQGTASNLGALSPGYFAGSGLTDLYGGAPGTCGIFYGTQTAGVFTPTSQMAVTYDEWIYDPETKTAIDGWVFNQPIVCPSIVFKYRIPADINGDGITDAFIHQRIASDEAAFFPLINNGANTLINPGPQTSGGGYFLAVGLSALVGDFNGDGRVDLLGTPDGVDYYTYIGDGTGGFTNTTPVSGSTFFVGDFDGDGCSDILSYAATSTITYSCAPASASAATPSLANAEVIIADFNGDGKDDLLVVPTNGANAKLYLSTGTGFSAGYTIPSSSDWYKYQIVTGDWNGDGKVDIALIAAGNSGGYGVGTSHKVFISTGTGFTQIQTIANKNSADTAENAVVADLNNDGAADFWLQKPSGDTEYLFSYIPELITTVTNGIGVTTTVTYDRLNHATLYTKGTGDAYPTQDVNGPIYVVARIDSSNAVGGNYSSTYAYTGAKDDLSGRGFLGFASMAITDLQTGVVQTTNYLQTFPYIGLVASQTKTLNGATLNSTTNSYASTTSAGAAQFVYLTQTVQASNDLDGTALPTVTTVYNSYDSYGNATQVTVSTPDGASKVTNSTYANDTTNWFLGRLTQSSVTSTVGSSVITRTSSFAYGSTTGLLTNETIEPNTAALTLATAYVYDSFGNKHTATVTGGSGESYIASRTTTSTYDSKGQFATTITNALSQSETWAYSPSFGLATSHTGPNNLTTTWTYDTFGRPTLQVKPDGAETKYAYEYCSGVAGGTAACPANGAFLVQTTTLGSDGATQIAPVSTVYYDALSRQISTQVQGFASGTVIESDTIYDANGRTYQVSQPYFVGSSTVYWTTNTFDALGRTVTSTLPNTGVVKYAYHGLTTSVTDPNSHTTTTVKNDQGLNYQVTDANGKTVSYLYDAFGGVLTVTDSAGNVTTNTYDTRGRKITASDPDRGNWSYSVDALSEVVSQTNGKGQTSTVTYDLLGRMTKRVEPDLTSTWTYDTAAHGVGSLAQATTNATYSRTFTYDALGRPATVALSYAGNNASYTTTYDTISGKAATVAYPSGLTIKNVYNAYGYLSQIKDSSSGTAYWTANARDEFLNLINETAGNGVTTTRTFNPETGRISTIQAGTSNAVANFAYTFDLAGNLTQRVDNDLSRTDNFTYDALNRLYTYSIAGGAYQTMGYDALGDITSKPGVGTYAYPTAGQPHPHAITSITGTVRGVVNPTFAYDADGNMTSGPATTIGYTSFDMPESMTVASVWGAFNWGAPNNWLGTTMALYYDSEHHRVEMEATAGSTFYFNDPISGMTSELYTPTSGPAQWRSYITADGRTVAEQIAVSGGSTTTQYFVSDHLGSIAVVEDSSGNVLQRLIYDPWGQQLSQTGAPICGNGDTTRGFTGEEQMPAGCFVNLNARVYDPILGQFVSADPVIGDLYDQRMLNPYSYVQNNPLSLVDPNGDCGPVCLLIWVIIDVAVAEALKPVFEHNPLLGDLFVLFEGIQCGPLCAAEGAGVIAGVTSGSVVKGFEAFVVTLAEAGMFKDVGDNLEGLQALDQAGLISDFQYSASAFIEHGFVGGLFAAVSGNGSLKSIGSGFLSAGVTELAAPSIAATSGSPALGAVESAIVGGTTSVIGGGKFADGAVTAAFGYLFNYCAHNGCWTTPQERSFLNRGDFLGYYNAACEGGDLYACYAYGVAAGTNPGPDAALRQGLFNNGYSLAEINALVTQTIPLDLAEDYANYLPQNENQALFPSASAIAQFHWSEFAIWGLPPSTFGGTPFGASGPIVMKGLWCPSSGTFHCN